MPSSVVPVSAIIGKTSIYHVLGVKRQKIKQWIRISFLEQLEANYIDENKAPT